MLELDYYTPFLYISINCIIAIYKCQGAKIYRIVTSDPFGYKQEVTTMKLYCYEYIGDKDCHD